MIYFSPFVCLLVLFALPSQGNDVKGHHFQKNKPILNQQCTTCHQQAKHDWMQSDHSNAMAIANKSSVLGRFDNKNVEHYGQKANFFIDDNRYQVTISYGDKSDTYSIKYTFSYFPLQQYLVETELGKLQVLPFAWDSRTKADGGQRWYHNYSHEEIRPQDRLHWRQPLQNWNGMCADCHSDGLQRNYQIESNSFKTQFDNINVGCLSCHSDMSDHAEKKALKKDVSVDVKSNELLKYPNQRWLRILGKNTASWQGETRDNSFMDTCFACHSLRSPLSDGINPKKAFLEQFTPQLLAAPNYYADGQIKEEVYVYGSFLQSKMFAAGVNCLDCHDKHTMKLKAQDNSLCLQCHSGEVFNAKSHHQHNEDSTGAQCVNCHMPETRYMGVDDRRDHSFKIPRPDLSIKFNTPNACKQCHNDKSNQWASNTLEKWHGKPQALLSSKKHLMALNLGRAITIKQHLSIIEDEKLDTISRATALEMLSVTTQVIAVEKLIPYLTHKEPLLRLSATRVGVLLPPKEREQYVGPSLSDKYKAIRVAAARSLVTSGIFKENHDLFTRAFNELLAVNELNSWRGEGRANQASLAFALNDARSGEKLLKETIKIEPYFDVGYINLSELYRSQQRPALVASVLIKGMKKAPLSGTLNYLFGLHLVREKELNKAILYFEKSIALTPDHPQYAYTFVLALDGLGKSENALQKLKSLIIRYQDKTQLKELGLYLSKKLSSRADYELFINM